jgi:ATP-dependent DNA helicase RecQ
MDVSQSSSSVDHLRSLLQHLWGYSDFRPPQGEIVQTLLAQRDALIILPTGGGKSLCFQLPALMQSGLTLVISPLVALMENQVQELRQRRLPAALLHGEMPAMQRKQVLWALETQRLRLLYLSPETLLSPSVWQRLCAPDLKINGLILDYVTLSIFIQQQQQQETRYLS